MKRHRTGLTIGFAVIVVAVFAALLWHPAGFLYGLGFQKLTPGQQVTAIDATRGRLIQFGAGLLAFGALVFTALNFRLSREGHVTDRYTKAIEQLGSDRLDVRLGAIYALERIMIDSRRDHPTIVEVLAAYVREHSPKVNPADQDPDTEFDPPATDVQAVLTVLGRRPPKREERGELNLRYTRLTGADLAETELAYANLTGADLRRAHLQRAHLRRTYLDRADLRDADLAGADLTDAQLIGTDLRGANLSFAKLGLAILIGADLGGAKLRGAVLAGADLRRVDLTSAGLSGEQLKSVDLGRSEPDPTPKSAASPPPSASEAQRGTDISGQV